MRRDGRCPWGATAPQHAADRVIVRMDAGFNGGELCARLEEEEEVCYLMRLDKNSVREQMADPYLHSCSSETATYMECMRPVNCILIW